MAARRNRDGSTKKSTSKTKANARGLKAANRPLSKGNAELVKKVGAMTQYIAMDRRPTPEAVSRAMKNGTSIWDAAKKIAMSEMRKNSTPKKISSAQAALNKKMSTKNNKTKTVSRVPRGRGAGMSAARLGAGGGMNWQNK